MSSLRALPVLSYKRLSKSELSSVHLLDHDPEQVRSYLGSIGDIVSAVGKGLSHGLFMILDGSGPVGFYVIHPDLRDRSRWWLGWFTIDHRHQGLGYGHAALRHIVVEVARISGCRAVRLLVHPLNQAAMRLYAAEGFVPTGVRVEGEEIMELPTANRRAAADYIYSYDYVLARALRVFHRRRLRPAVGPYAARMIGVVRGPPGCCGRPERQG